MDERRYYGLDALRGAMMVLGIVLHAAMLYLSDPPPAVPIPIERNNGYAFDLTFAFIHSFRMPTFFVLAGFFAALLVEKRGLQGMLLNRAWRIAAPLAGAIATILPVTVVLWLDFLLSVRFGTHDVLPDGAALRTLEQEVAARGGVVGRLPLAHLWFLYYLCFFYLLVPLCQGLVERSVRMEAQVRQWLAGRTAPIVLALYTSLTLWPFHGGQVYEGFAYFRPHLPSVLYYGSFFVMGYFFHHYRDAAAIVTRRVPAAAVASVLLFPLSMVASHLDNSASGSDLLLHVFAVIANAFCTWALIFVLIGAALRYFDRDAPWIIYLSQSSYWVFLVHMPLVLLAGWWLVPYDVPSGGKFLAVCGFAGLCAFLSFHYWVQRSWMSDFLYGRRFQLKWPWEVAPAGIR